LFFPLRRERIVDWSSEREIEKTIRHPFRGQSRWNQKQLPDFFDGKTFLPFIVHVNFWRKNLFPHFNFSFSTLGNFYFSNVDALPSALVRKGKKIKSQRLRKLSGWQTSAPWWW
jgi:hypothetical protein